MATIGMDDTDGLWTIYISNPGRKNAWTSDMRAQFRRLLDAADAATATECRGLIVTGGTDDAFCAGGDLSESARWDENDTRRAMDEIYATLRAVMRCSKPIVAAVRGVAVGSGLQLALCCDMVVTHPEARFGQPEIRSGIPSVVGIRLLRHFMGDAWMKEMILSGQLVAGQRAHEFGLVNRLAPKAEVVQVAGEVLATLGAIDQVAYAASKLAIADLVLPELQAGFRDVKRSGRAATAATTELD